MARNHHRWPRLGCTIEPTFTVDELPAAVSLRGFSNPIIQMWSRGAEALYGYSASEVVGRVAHDLLASVFPAPLAEIEEVVRTEGEWVGSVRSRRRDGTWITVLASWRLRRDSVGFPESIFQIALPLALERKAGAERELLLSGAVARLERRGVGQTAELEQLDATVARLELEGVGQIAELERRDATVARLERRDEGQTAELEERDAEVARLELAGVGQTAELEQRDATVDRLELRELGRTAALESAVQELDAFAYSVSHDLRTPLRAINGYAQALRDEYGAGLPPAAQSDLARIERAASRMGNLIDDLLRLSRITRSTLVRRRIDLADIAREVAARTAGTAVTRSDVRWEIDDHAWATGDRGLLEIALENLIGNAWKFTAKRSGAVISFTSAESAEGLVFTVRDDGVGFDMAHAGKLFTPFHRLHSSREFEGTGIGLAIVQRIVRRHGGLAWAEAEVGQGAAVHFTLPAAVEEAS